MVPEGKLKELTEAVIGAAFEVSNQLGHGFLESVYQKALTHEFGLRGLEVEEQVSFPVDYKGKGIGVYTADMIVEGKVILELKAVRELGSPHTAQLLNYLSASKINIGLLLNFGRPKIEVKRVVR